MTFHTSNAPIKAASLTAQYATLETSNSPIDGRFRAEHELSAHTTNSPIEGSFNTSDSLALTTTNSPIKAEVYVQNDDGKKASSAVLKTTNRSVSLCMLSSRLAHSSFSRSPIESEITLASSAKHSTGGSFHIDATTSNGPLALDFPSAPLDSTLKLAARTTTLGATVRLPAAYEGRFYATSTLLGAKVTVTEQQDPAGRRRKRAVVGHTDQPKNSVQGAAYWDEANKERGSVDVRSTISPVELIF